MAKSTETSGVFSPGEYYNLHEFAKRCGLTVRIVRERYVNTGLLTVSRLGKGAEIVPFHEAARFFEELLGCDENDGQT